MKNHYQNHKFHELNYQEYPSNMHTTKCITNTNENFAGILKCTDCMVNHENTKLADLAGCMTINYRFLLSMFTKV